MFDFLKANRINKISKDHTENISDYLIMLNIVNSQDAKKNLTKDEYRRFFDTFGKIAKRKEAIPTNSLQYEQRAFTIAYEFEHDAEVPYAKICGDATDILYMYSNMKPRYDSLIDDVYNEYNDIISSIIWKNNLNEKEGTVWGYAVTFFEMTTSTIISSYRSLLYDFFTKFVYEMAFKKMGEMIASKYLTSSEAITDFRSNRQKMRDIHQHAYDNSATLDDYIENYTNSFLFLIGSENSLSIKAPLTGMLFQLKQLGENDHKDATPQKIASEMNDPVVEKEKHYTAKELEYINMIKDNDKTSLLTLDDAKEIFEIISIGGGKNKAKALKRAEEFKNRLKKQNPSFWFTTTSYMYGVLNANGIINQSEMELYSTADTEECIQMNFHDRDKFQLVSEHAYWSNLFKDLPNPDRIYINTAYIKQDQTTYYLQFNHRQLAEKYAEGTAYNTELVEYIQEKTNRKVRVISSFSEPCSGPVE